MELGTVPGPPHPSTRAVASPTDPSPAVADLCLAAQGHSSAEMASASLVRAGYELWGALGVDCPVLASSGAIVEVRPAPHPHRALRAH